MVYMYHIFIHSSVDSRLPLMPPVGQTKGKLDDAICRSRASKAWSKEGRETQRVDRGRQLMKGNLPHYKQVEHLHPAQNFQEVLGRVLVPQ